MRKLLFILLMVLITGCSGDLMEGVGGDTDETPPTLEQKLRGIWIIGGAEQPNGTGIYSELDLYDPMTDTWYTDVAAGASGNYAPSVFNAAAYSNGRIYVMGGAINSASATSAVYEYDIENNSWSLKQNIQNLGADVVLMGSAAYTYSDYVYLIGGTTATTTAGVQVYNIRFDPGAGTLGTWSNMLNYTTARSSMGAVCVGGIAYYFGGRIAGGAGQTTNNGYIIATNTHTAALTAITARAGMAYASHEGANGTYIFIVGGAPTYAAATAYFSMVPTYVAAANSFQIYVPQGTITNGKFHPAFSGGTTTGIVFAGAAVSPYNGDGILDPTLYVFGGIKNQPAAATDEVWAITADDTLGGYPTATWYSKTPMPRARYGHSVVIAGQ